MCYIPSLGTIRTLVFHLLWPSPGFSLVAPWGDYCAQQPLVLLAHELASPCFPLHASCTFSLCLPANKIKINKNGDYKRESANLLQLGPLDF